MSLANVRVPTKLYLGFSVTLSLMLIIIASSLLKMRAINEDIARIVTLNNVRGYNHPWITVILRIFSKF